MSSTTFISLVPLTSVSGKVWTWVKCGQNFMPVNNTHHLESSSQCILLPSRNSSSTCLLNTYLIWHCVRGNTKAVFPAICFASFQGWPFLEVITGQLQLLFWNLVILFPEIGDINKYFSHLGIQVILNSLLIYFFLVFQICHTTLFVVW